MTDIVRKSLNLLLKQQTNILSAAFIIMVTVIFSQILGLFRQRLLVSIFGASNTLGIYGFASKLPDFIFQIVIAAALSSAFIPVFSHLLAKGEEKEADKTASSLLSYGLLAFLLLAVILFIFAPFFLTIFNLGANFSKDQMILMTNIMRILLFGQFLFIIGSFFSAVLQSHRHFFIPGIALASYNMGIILGILLFSGNFGIYSAPFGAVLGSLIFILIQVPLIKKIGFTFTPSLSVTHHVKRVFHLMGPRVVSIFIFFLGTNIMLSSFTSYLTNPGRMHIIFDLAQTLAFAPIALFANTIGQAALPILSREKDKPEAFKETFISSFNQILYLVLPISVIILVLRIPIVRLVYGADMFDWDATVLTGRVLAFFSLSIFAQALINFLYRAFYALQNTLIPLFVGTVSTAILIILGYIFIVINGYGVQSLAIAFTLTSLFQLVVLFLVLDRQLGGFNKRTLMLSSTKFFFATLFTSFALYIPIKLLDQLVFDTTRTINLIILTGISAFAGLSLYLFLTWLFNVREAYTYISMLKKLGNWKEILGKSDEVIDPNRTNP
jgi:putative peptidoglycan lipid II flippase